MNVRTIILIMTILFCGISFGQEADSTKSKEIEQLKARNAAVENAFINVYLQQQNKEPGKAFMDLYLYVNQLEAEHQKMSQTIKVVNQMINDIVKVKSLKELDEVLKKYDIEREKAK